MIKVLQPGFYTSVQDLGRFDSQKFGVPISGAMDSFAAQLANTLLGNSKDCAVLEMTMIGATLEFTSDTLICLSGAKMSPRLNQKELSLNKVIQIRSGDILSLGKARQGFRCYLAVLGGFKTEQVLQSKSMYRGITKDFVLRKGDQVKIEAFNFKEINQHASLRIDISYLSSSIIEVYKGPEFHLLSEEQKQKLFSSWFEVTKDNNRMAYQLLPVITNSLKPIITSLVMPGTVQLTPSGKLIVLMRDCQTTGGYPRVLQLTEDGINILSQKNTAQSLRFKLKDI